MNLQIKCRDRRQFYLLVCDKMKTVIMAAIWCIKKLSQQIKTDKQYNWVALPRFQWDSLWLARFMQSTENNKETNKHFTLIIRWVFRFVGINNQILSTHRGRCFRQIKKSKFRIKLIHCHRLMRRICLVFFLLHREKFNFFSLSIHLIGVSWWTSAKYSFDGMHNRGHMVDSVRHDPWEYMFWHI